MSDSGWSVAFANRRLWISIGWQFAGAAVLMMGQLRWIARLNDPGKRVHARTGMLFARWVAMLLIGMLAVPFPREIYLVLVVLAYAAGTVALELVPERVLIAINAQNLLDALTPGDDNPVAAAAAARPHDGSSTSVWRHLRRHDGK